MSNYITIRCRVGMTVRQMARLAMVDEGAVKYVESGQTLGERTAGDGTRVGAILSAYRRLDDQFAESSVAKDPGELKAMKESVDEH